MPIKGTIAPLGHACRAGTGPAVSAASAVTASRSTAMARRRRPIFGVVAGWGREQPPSAPNTAPDRSCHQERRPARIRAIIQYGTACLIALRVRQLQEAPWTAWTFSRRWNFCSMMGQWLRRRNQDHGRPVTSASTSSNAPGPRRLVRRRAKETRRTMRLRACSAASSSVEKFRRGYGHADRPGKLRCLHESAGLGSPDGAHKGGVLQALSRSEEDP